MIDKESFKNLFADAIAAHETNVRAQDASTYTRKVLLGLFKLALEYEGGPK